MAGILPVAFHEGKVYFLFGRETIYMQSKDMGKWSDFGGMKEKNESAKETAIREGWEETSGILGDIEKIRYLVEHKLVKEFKNWGYTTFVVQIPYRRRLPSTYGKMYSDALKYRGDEVRAYNGLYEKDQIKWVELNDLKKIIPLCRPWYSPMVKKINKHFSKTE